METESGLRLIQWMSFILCFSNYCDASSHRSLKDYLLSDYGSVHIRPVKKTSTITPVTFRPLLVNLVDMDTKKQQFTFFSWLKTVWIDEFLRWNASDFDNTSLIYLPSAAVWKPDITLLESPEFQRYQPDSLVEVYPDGTVYWYVPAIFTGHCPMSLKWFPFDSHVCTMTFLSWTYSGKDVDLFPDESLDGQQTLSYLVNGVWNLVQVDVKKIASNYTCCEFLYYSLQFRLVFQRQALFYINYMIIPVVLISFLAVTVFFLPPDLGAKLQFAITNLLALSFFENLIAEVIPPSADNNPVLDLYFQIMITMVSLSVVATVLVINISSKSEESVPDWVKWLVLENLSRVVNLHPAVERLNARIKSDNKSKSSNSFKSIAFNSLLSSDIRADTSMDNNGTVHLSTTQELKSCSEHWKLIGLVTTRCFALLFSAVVTITTITLFLYVWLNSQEEFERALGVLKDEWEMLTYINYY